MPQIRLTIAPNVKSVFSGEESKFALERICDSLTADVESVFGLEGEHDVSFTATNAEYTHNEANLQVEVRYSAGEDEYDWGKPFEPTKEEREELARRIAATLRREAPSEAVTVSVWVIPYRDTAWLYA